MDIMLDVMTMRDNKEYQGRKLLGPCRSSGMHVAALEPRAQGFGVPEREVTYQFFVFALPFPGDSLAGQPLDAGVAAPPFCEPASKGVTSSRPSLGLALGWPLSPSVQRLGRGSRRAATATTGEQIKLPRIYPFWRICCCCWTKI